MGKEENEELTPASIRAAITKVAAHQLHARLRQVDGYEAHMILPEIFPIIQELCILADAAQAGLLEVKG